MGLLVLQPTCDSYFICDKKLLELGWTENTPWEVRPQDSCKEHHAAKVAKVVFIYTASDCSSVAFCFLSSRILQEGLRKTVEWYLKNGMRSYWDHGDMDQALEAHPTLQLPSTVFNGGR